MALETVAIVLGVAAVVLAVIYRYLTSTFHYFVKRGVDGPKPTPLFGSWWGIWNKFQGEQDLVDIQQFGKVYGTFDGRTPALVVAEPTLVAAVLGREAASFRDRRAYCVQNLVIRQSLLALVKGDKQDTAAKTSPTSSVQAKLGSLVPLFSKAADCLSKNLLQKAEENEGKVEICKQVSSYVADVLASAVFGLDLEKSTELKEQFIKYCNQAFFNPNPDSALSFVPFLYPGLTPLDGFILSQEGLKFFSTMCKSTIEERQKSEKTETSMAKVTDLVGLCVEAAEEERTTLGKAKGDDDTEVVSEAPASPVFTDEQVVAECLAVILKTSLVTRKLVTLSLHALASKPEVQQKLVSGLTRPSGTEHGLDYEMIQNNKYLDMFMNEIERIYPSYFRVERVCNDAMELNKYKIEKGSVVSIPVFALHHLEEFYPQPENFDPERFSPESVEKHTTGTFLPYGQLDSSARNLSVQFGVLAAKIAIASLTMSLKFTPAEETQIPPEFEKGMTSVLRPREFILVCEARNN